MGDKDDGKDKLKVELEINLKPADHKEILHAIEGLRRVILAESAEVAAFRARVEAAMANIAADIQRILAGATGLSAEDKAALETIATNLENLAGVVPEDGGNGGTPV